MSSLEATEPRARRRSWLQRLRWPVMIGVVVLAVLIGLFVYLTGGRYESTDDAQVGGARVSVSSTVAGRVVELDVRDNQLVRPGQVLFRLDPRPFQTAYDQAAANLSATRLQIEQLKAAYRQREADVKTAEASLAYAQIDARRQTALVAAGTGTTAQSDQATNQVEQARQRLDAAKQAAASALAALDGDANISPDQHPLVQQARAQVARAQLDQSYVEVVASQEGIVTKVDQLQVGDYINAGSPVFSLVSDRQWIDANFKENQLEYMRAGQKATVKIDAYPDRRFDALVEAITPGTGSSFSLLPAENATGNWVKVTQRVPVRIVFAHDPGVPLPPGISATVTIDTTHRRHLFGPESPR
ncbi:MAG: HlyD family secretion protein [Caulobacteraceae bacterium]|nr:HlyD family secretion protein [Caulobacteraceae bacterium]